MLLDAMEGDAEAEEEQPYQRNAKAGATGKLKRSVLGMMTLTNVTVFDLARGWRGACDVVGLGR